MNRAVMPTSIAPPAANYTHAVASESPSRWLHTSGVVPVASDGTTPTEIGGQASVVWANIAAILTEVRMEPSDILSVTTYAVTGSDLAGVMAARDRFLNGHLAASTLVIVSALARPEWLMEIAIVAAR